MVGPESPNPIPQHCRACPFLYSTSERYEELEAELYLLEHSQQIEEYADRQDIDDRIGQLRLLTEQHRNELDQLQALTVGCAGVKLAQVKIGDEFLTSAECQSPLKS